MTYTYTIPGKYVSNLFLKKTFGLLRNLILTELGIVNQDMTLPVYSPLVC